jgi:hypothetical protein
MAVEACVMVCWLVPLNRIVLNVFELVFEVIVPPVAVKSPARFKLAVVVLFVVKFNVPELSVKLLDKFKLTLDELPFPITTVAPEIVKAPATVTVAVPSARFTVPPDALKAPIDTVDVPVVRLTIPAVIENVPPIVRLVPLLIIIFPLPVPETVKFPVMVVSSPLKLNTLPLPCGLLYKILPKL